MNSYNWNIDSCEKAFDYEKLIMQVWLNIPKNIQVISYEWLYFHWDPCYRITLANNKSILLRIWLKHMNDWNENKIKMQQGEISISGYLEEGNSKSHLPLYWWYKHNDYSWIWWKILEK